MARLLVIFLTTLVGLGFLFTSLEKEVVDLDVRVSVPRTPAGRVFQSFRPGQLFRCDFQNLQRIDVLVNQQGDQPYPGLFMELRRVPEGAADKIFAQEVVRSAPMVLPEGSTGVTWAVFSFETITDSKGALFHFVLQPDKGEYLSHWSPFFSPRATTGEVWPWGGLIEGSQPTLEFRARHSELSAIALGVDGLDAAAGDPHVILYELPLPGSPYQDPKPVARGVLNHKAPIAAGYALFTFPPIAGSRYRDYRAEWHLPENARIVGQDGTPAAVTYYGQGQISEEPLGQTLVQTRFPHRDLIFRALGEDGAASNWRKLKERGAAGRYLFALLAFGAAMGLALTAVWRS